MLPELALKIHGDFPWKQVLLIRIGRSVALEFVLLLLNFLWADRFNQNPVGHPGFCVETCKSVLNYPNDLLSFMDLQGWRLLGPRFYVQREWWCPSSSTNQGRNFAFSWLTCFPFWFLTAGRAYALRGGSIWERGKAWSCSSRISRQDRHMRLWAIFPELAYCRLA